MSISDENKLNTTEAVENPETDAPESEVSEDLTEAGMEDTPMTLEDLELDISEPSMTYTATLHFEFSDIFNAIEHIENDPELEVENELESEPEIEPETEVESEPEPKQGTDKHIEAAETSESEELITEAETEQETESADPQEEEPETDEPVTEYEEAAKVPETEPEPEKDFESSETNEATGALPVPAPKSNLLARLKGQDTGTKKLMLTDTILLAVVLISIVVGLVVANSLVNKANAANEAKLAEMQANIKEVNLSNSLYKMAANQVIEDVAVPTYTLDELYALDLREKTGFTAEDLKLITRKGLVGCEEAFVKAEETYGVNSIFLMSIASLESAYGTQMFRPNNMFGYGRTGFSSKEECIMTVAKGLGTKYLPPGGSLYGGSPTLKGVNKRYAANPQWYYKVGKYMQGYYAELAAEKNGALDKFELRR